MHNAQFSIEVYFSNSEFRIDDSLNYIHKNLLIQILYK